MSSRVKETLKEHDLRNTSCREDVLDVLTRYKTALSHGEIERELDSRFDRVTIYRTLKTFVDKGIIHKVLDEEGLRYAICKEACSGPHHRHDHIHFKCNVCGLTNCIENISIPSIPLPDGYQSTETSLLMQGTCPKCKEGK
jgi:Fur family ferric uptake transcriptional regulator